MQKIQLNNPPPFLTHHLLLRPDCLVRMTLPTHLTQQEADRLSDFLNALVLSHSSDDGMDWPFEMDLDPDGDLNEEEIDAEDVELEESETSMEAQRFEDKTNT